MIPSPFPAPVHTYWLTIIVSSRLVHVPDPYFRARGEGVGTYDAGLLVHLSTRSVGEGNVRIRSVKVWNT